MPVCASQCLTGFGTGFGNSGQSGKRGQWVGVGHGRTR
jgi:hypothetical protein